MVYLGDFNTSQTVHFQWSTVGSSGQSITRATNGTVSVYKDNGTTQTTTGVTDTEDFDSLTGIHACTIDLSADTSFYSAAGNFTVVLSAATIDGQTVNEVLAHFSVLNRASGALRTGTAQAGAAGSITLDSGANSNNEYYTMARVQIVAGTGAGQSRYIYTYTGSSKVAYVSPNWVTNPDSTSIFRIIPDGVTAADVFSWAAANNGGGYHTTAQYTVEPMTAPASGRQRWIPTHPISDIAASQTGHSTTTVKLNSGSSPVDDIYNGQVIYLRGNGMTGDMCASVIVDYNGTTKVATVYPPFPVTPANSIGYIIFPSGQDSNIVLGAAADAVWDEARSGHTTAGTFGEGVASVTGNVAGNVTGSVGSVASGGISSGSFAAGAINAAAIATDAIGAAELAADAVAEIQSGLATAAALATVQADTDDIQTRLPAALVSGRMDASVGAMAADVVTATAIATDAIGSAELAASAVSEIQSGLATAAALALVQADTDDIQTRLPAALVSGRIDASVGAIAANAITAASIATDAIDADAIASDAANEIADALLDRTAGVETNRTLRQALRLILAACAGKLSGAATTTVAIRDTNDSKDRISATVDASGNRTAVTLDSS